MSQHSDPLISIITPVYNADRFLDETIASVQAQTYPRWELLLILDQKTSDQSLEISRGKAQQDPRIRVIEDPRAMNTSANRNLGLDLARGEFVAFLDADDTWPKNKLQVQLNWMLENHFEFGFTAFQRMSRDGTKISPPAQIPHQVDYYDLLKLNSLAIHTVLISKKLLSDHRFPQTPHEDFAFWLEILRDQRTLAQGLNQPLAFYRSVPGSRANNKVWAAIWRWHVLRNQERLSFPVAFYYFLQYAVRATLLHLKTRVEE